LTLVLPESLARVSALKNAVSTVVGLGTVVAFGVFGPVDWKAVAILAPATMLGGYAGARLARRLPARALRVVIVTVGTLVGLAGALATTRIAVGLVKGVEPNDPLTLVVVTAVLLASALLAAYLPARRAARVDPMTALRAE